jgi:hypothetical protein
MVDKKVCKKTVLFFDSWTKGRQHFKRLQPELDARGYKCILIHIGSWGHDKLQPIEEVDGGLVIRDVSYYGGLSLLQIIKMEHPSAIIFLSTRAFVHQAFNRYARSLLVPTIHLYHGLVSVQAVNSSRSLYRVSPLQKTREIFSKAYKNIFKIIPVYVVSLIKTKAAISDWFSLLYEIKVKAVGGSGNGVAPKDSSTTIGCVYTDADVDHMVNCYRIKRADVFVVGNPDLEKFGVKEFDFGYCLRGRKVFKKQVVYLETALVASSLVFRSQSQYVEYLCRLNQSLRQQGYSLVVKMHPASVLISLDKKLSSNQISLCDNSDLLKLLRESAAAIVEPSTIALLPALLGLPVLLAGIGELKNQTYGKVLTDYPGSFYMSSVDCLEGVFNYFVTQNTADKFDAWLNRNSGPMPSESMPKRVADAVTSIARP